MMKPSIPNELDKISSTFILSRKIRNIEVSIPLTELAKLSIFKDDLNTFLGFLNIVSHNEKLNLHDESP